MQIPSSLIPVIGPILAAVIAGAVAFLASVFTKESKTSEFRQAWIDGIRDDISDFIGTYYWVSDVASQRPNELDTLKDEFIKLERMQARIELRLNDKKEHKEILRQLHGLVRFETFSVQDSRARTAAVSNFVAESRQILKGEWNRVKRGELTYRITKWASLLAFSTFAIIAVLLVRGHVIISYAP
jgi:hypothetical protein